MKLLYAAGNIYYTMGNWNKAKESFLRYSNTPKKHDLFFSVFFAYCREYNDIAAIESTKCNPYIKEYYLKYHYMNEKIKHKLFSDIPHFSDEYLFQTLRTCKHHLLKCSVRVRDMESEYVNVSDGARRTAGIPEKYSKTIYLLGSSPVFCTGAEDSHTIASFLQSIYNSSSSESTRVVNLGVNNQRHPNALLCIMSEKLQKNDMVLYFPLLTSYHFKDNHSAGDFRYYRVLREFCTRAGASFHIALYPSILRVENPSMREQSMQTMKLHKENISEELRTNKGNFKEYCERLRKEEFSFLQLDGIAKRPHSMGEIFWDPMHVNHRGNKAIAEETYKHLAQSARIKKFDVGDEEMASVVCNAKQYLGEVAQKNYAAQSDIAQWLREVKNPQFDNCDSIGAIVMNCNPFTLGHKYLVESAAKMVDGLYIFVVQEDKSFFPFADRLELVRRGVAEIPGSIHVVPSGKYIISTFGFPGYFSKAQAMTPADSTTDVAIFGSIIAPALGITHRFVGEEPNCLTTNEYNETMLFLLPSLGVEMHVIPRKNESGQPISATTVRDCMNNNDFESIAKLVPATTYEYLKGLSVK